MTLINQAVIDQLLVPSILRFFFIGGLFSLAVGAGLIISSNTMFRFFGTMNHWVSFRRSFKPMSIPRDSAPVFQRNRRWFAVVFIVGAMFSIFNLVTRVDTHTLVSLIAMKLQFPRAFIAWIVESMWWFLMIGCLLAIAVGVMLGFFPSTAFAIEAGSRRWYSFRGLTKSADTMHFTLDEWIAGSPRAAGWVIVVVSLVELIDIGSLMF